MPPFHLPLHDAGSQDDETNSAQTRYIRQTLKFLCLTVIFLYFLLNLRLQTVLKPRSRAEGREAWHNEKRLSALILDVSEFSQNSYWSQGLSNGRCPWICNILHSVWYSVRNMAGGIGYIYKRRASSLPSDFNRAMREASRRRTVTDTDSYAFLI